jgi:hypothetical protein
MKSTQTLCATLTLFLAVVFQCHISAAQDVVTQTGRETIESYDSATERLTISVEYIYQWLPGPARSFTVPLNVVGAVSFSATGAGGCTQINTRTIRCPSGITGFRISYRYQLQINATEDGREEFTYQSGFARQAGLTNAKYDLFFPPSWTFHTVSPEPNPNVEEPGHFQWVLQNINAFTAQVRFQTETFCPAGLKGDSSRFDAVDTLTEKADKENGATVNISATARLIDLLKLMPDFPKNISEAEACRMYPDLCKAERLPGEDIEPPGECGWERLNELEALKAICLLPHKCREDMSCFALSLRTPLAQECVNTRRQIMVECYEGGNLTHYRELLKEEGVLKNCNELLGEECMSCK